MVESTDPGWFQSAFEMLIGLFDWVGIQKNVRKTAGMMFSPCRASGVRVDEAYTCRMTGEERSFKEQHQEQVLCP